MAECGHCRDCKSWMVDDDAVVRAGRHLCDRNGPVRHPTDADKAYGVIHDQDGRAYATAWIETAADFGCVMYEPKG